MSKTVRYSRQMILPEVGGTGQKKWGDSSALVVGAGGLGSPVALYLAAAGVGNITLLDADRVDPSNLHRQILHFSSDVGSFKVLSARRKLKDLNPLVRVDAQRVRLTDSNAARWVRGKDVVLDGSDNFETRYAVNAACVKQGTPLVWGAVSRWQGLAMTIFPRRSACYACLFPEPPDPAVAQSCFDTGIIGPVAGTVGTIMATEGLKVLLGKGDPLKGRLMIFDFFGMRVREKACVRRRSCGVCGGG